MPLHRNPADRFDANLRIITRAGIEPPADIAALRERLDTFRRAAFTTAALDRVVDGIVTGTDTDLPVAWAAACAEFAITDSKKNELVNAVRSRVNAAIRDRYAAVAEVNYRTVADRFNTAAEAFTSAAAVCDPNQPAEAVVAASDRIRKAWQASADHAAELTKVLPVLKAAAELAGICGPDPDAAIDLAVDANGLSRDQITHAWDTPDREAAEARSHASGLPFTTPPPTSTRGGRWTALHAAGAVIRAVPISELEPVTAAH